jgi:hypothetical protein
MFVEEETVDYDGLDYEYACYQGPEGFAWEARDSRRSGPGGFVGVKESIMFPSSQYPFDGYFDHGLINARLSEATLLKIDLRGN